MMRTADIYSVTNPGLCGLVIWSFLNGYEKTNEYGCEFPILFLPLPLILSRSNRDTLLHTNSGTGLQTWIARHPEVLVDLSRQVELCSDYSRDAIYFGVTNEITSVDNEGKFYSDNNGIVKSRLNVDGFDEIRDILSDARKLGYWFGETGSTKLILNSLGLTL